VLESALDVGHREDGLGIRERLADLLAAAPQIIPLDGQETVTAGDVALMRGRWQMTPAGTNVTPLEREAVPELLATRFSLRALRSALPSALSG
jgi:hypothetical protein